MIRMRPVLLCLIGLAGLCAPAQSLYKWQDENGKWHFSDTPPPDAAGVEEITGPGPGNTIEQHGTNQRLKTQFPEMTPEERAHQQRRKKSREEQTATACRRARNTLARLEGRVVFLDDAGNPVEVSEEEREARARRLRREIARRCP